MFTKEHAKILGLVVIGSFVGGLAALALHQRVISPMLVVKPASAPKVS